MNPNAFQLKPRMSEKAYTLSQTQNVYVIDVASDATKQSVAAAITEQFKVTVIKVNITNVKGKAKRTIAKKGRLIRKGHNNAVRKAYVTLKANDKLPFFAAVEEAEAKEKAAEEKAAKAAKSDTDKTESKPRRGIHLRGRKDNK